MKGSKRSQNNSNDCKALKTQGKIHIKNERSNGQISF